MTQRRDFLAQLGVLASTMALDADELQAGGITRDGSDWDTSWIARVETAKHRAIFNTTDINDGVVLSYVSTFLDLFRDLHGTTDQQTRAIAMLRRGGAPMGFNDHLWERYEIGVDRSINDPATGAPARRNIYWKATSGGATSNSSKLEGLTKRGLISLVCNVSVGVWSERMAEKTGQSKDAVRAEVVANLIPGATLVPSGIYALIRAQNAGCAYMPGT